GSLLERGDVGRGPPAGRARTVHAADGRTLRARPAALRAAPRSGAGPSGVAARRGLCDRDPRRRGPGRRDLAPVVRAGALGVPLRPRDRRCDASGLRTGLGRRGPWRRGPPRRAHRAESDGSWTLRRATLRAGQRPRWSRAEDAAPSITPLTLRRET